VLRSPRRFGKTWLLDYLWHDFRRRQGDRARMARLSLRDFSGAQRHDLDGFLYALGSQLAEALDRDLAALDAEWSRRLAAPQDRLRRAMKRWLDAADVPLLLAVDDADAVVDWPYRDDLFGMLRAWLEKPDDPWPRLRLILCISTTPDQLTRSSRISPFNLSPPIELDDFTAEQAASLAAHYGLAWDGDQLARLLGFVGGHPYLLRLVMHEVAAGVASLADLLAARGAQSPFADHLARYRQLFKEQPELPATLDAVARDGGAGLDDARLESLRRMGLVAARPGGGHALRGTLYEQLL
jgi:AAA domain-containing protein